MVNVDINIKILMWHPFGVKEKKMQISLAIIRPEDPLANGITDHLKTENIPYFGPSAKVAQIEASKNFYKNFMTRHGFPTTQFQPFTNVEETC